LQRLVAETIALASMAATKFASGEESSSPGDNHLWLCDTLTRCGVDRAAIAPDAAASNDVAASIENEVRRGSDMTSTPSQVEGETEAPPASAWVRFLRSYGPTPNNLTL